MKTDISHLPEKNQKELKDIARYIEYEVGQVSMVILFGSYARGDWVVDSYFENGTRYTYESDYDLLFVVKNEKTARYKTIDGRIRERIVKRTRIKTPLGIIYHGIEYLNEQLERSSYFFTDVYNEGIVLFDRGEYELVKPTELTLELKYEKARGYFDDWFENSDMFLLNYETNLAFAESKKQLKFLNLAAFNLHQATESLFTTINLVFTDYRPKTHDLNVLLESTSKLTIRVKGAFPLETEEEKRLFKILKDAYIKSRYEKGYTYEKSDLMELEKLVKNFREVTEKNCGEKIESYRKLLDNK